MKKIISLILCILIFTTLLTGCSSAELGYINLLQDLMEEEVIEFTGNYEVTFPEKAQLSFKGYLDTKNEKDMYADITFDLTVPTEEINIKNGRFIFTNKKTYISTNLMREILKSSEDETYLTIYDKTLSGYKYLSIDNSDEDWKEYLDSIKSTKEFTKRDKVDAILSLFDGFSSDMITGNKNGYTITINKDTVIKCIDNFVVFIDIYKEELFDGITEFVASNYNLIINDLLLSDSAVPSKEDIIAQMNEEKEEFITDINTFVSEYNNGLKEEIPNILYQLGNLEITETSNHIGNTYSFDTNGSISYQYPSYANSIYDGEEEIFVDGMTMETIDIKIKGELDITRVGSVIRKDFESDGIEQFYDFFEAENMTDLNYKKAYPATKMVISWSEEDNYAFTETINELEKTDYDNLNYVMKDDRIYLPLRAIAEEFGETIEWDHYYQRAYAIKNNVKFDMTGILVDGTTMVKIRDFEKLGYTVDYYSEYGQNVATITR